MSANESGDWKKLIHNLPAKSPAVEAYRALRTNLLFLSSSQELKSIAVTGASPSVGKSLTAANLAIALAQTGKSTLLVDADLRRPKLDRFFGVSSNGLKGDQQDLGLTHLLAGLVPSVDSYERSIEGLDDLYLLTSGPVPPNPAELLSGGGMHNFLAEARQEFDFIILDTPPIFAAADAVAVASMADGALLVVSDKCQYPVVDKARQALQRVNARVLGVVFNGAKLDGSSFYNYGY